MDFRDRHPDVKFWSHHALERFQHVYPYERLFSGSLYELSAFDNSTTFLVLTGSLSEDELTVTSYAIEAPPSCPTRRMFERGDLSWTDFFGHKTWLIEFTFFLFTDIPTQSKYIHPSNLCRTIEQRLQRLDLEGSPHKIYHDQIIQIWVYLLKHGVDTTDTEVEYEHFITQSTNYLSSEVIADGLTLVEENRRLAALRFNPALSAA